MFEESNEKTISRINPTTGILNSMLYPKYPHDEIGLYSFGIFVLFICNHSFSKLYSKLTILAIGKKNRVKFN